MNLQAVIEALSRLRPVFQSEADLQFALAWEIQKQHPEAAIRMEYRPAYLHRRGYLDIWVRRRDSIDAIELKYFTRALDWSTADERYELLNRSALDISRYDFVRDVERVESVVIGHRNTTGWVLAVANDAGYWKAPTGRDTFDRAFRIHERATLAGELSWAPGTGTGTMRGRERPLTLRGQYTMRWFDYSRPAPELGGTFRALLVKVAGLGNGGA